MMLCAVATFDTSTPAVSPAISQQQGERRELALTTACYVPYNPASKEEPIYCSLPVACCESLVHPLHVPRLTAFFQEELPQASTDRLHCQSQKALPRAGDQVGVEHGHPTCLVVWDLGGLTAVCQFAVIPGCSKCDETLALLYLSCRWNPKHAKLGMLLFSAKGIGATGRSLA